VQPGAKRRTWRTAVADTRPTPPEPPRDGTWLVLDSEGSAWVWDPDVLAWRCGNEARGTWEGLLRHISPRGLAPFTIWRLAR
jgi:hypothetical protein